jgi:hypothetical protein
VGSLRSLKREASKKTRIETVHLFLQDMLHREIKIPLQHPDYHYISIERELSDPISLPEKPTYYPNETFFWQVREIEFKLETYIGFTTPYINLLLKIKVPTRSELSWDGFYGFFSKKITLSGGEDLKVYYKFRRNLRLEIKENGLLGLPDFPEGWEGHEVT